MTSKNTSVATATQCPEDKQELDTSYEMYVSAYDRTIDTRPPLTRSDWENAYGQDVLREARQRLALVDAQDYSDSLHSS